MTTMESKLSNEIFDKYMSESQDQLNMLKPLILKSHNEAIIELIADYNTFKLLLCDLEFEEETQLLEYDTQYIRAKKRYLNKGDKPTEAKENAKDDLKETMTEILSIQRDISILKACIHSVEYQLRLKFAQLKQNTDTNDNIEFYLNSQ